MHETDFTSLHDMPGHLVRRLLQKAAASFFANLGETGLTAPQLSVLTVVGIREGLEQREVATATAHDAATIGGILNRLESRGLIRRERSDRSRRGRLIYLTGKGEKMLERIGPNVAAIQKEILAPLDPEEQRQLLALMSKAAGVRNSYHVPATPEAEEA